MAWTFGVAVMRSSSTATPTVSHLATHDSKTAPKRCNAVVRGRQCLLIYGRRNVECLSPHPFQLSRRDKEERIRSFQARLFFSPGMAPVLVLLRPWNAHILILRVLGARGRIGEICLSFQ